jgi:hypothetical protein
MDTTTHVRGPVEMTHADSLANSLRGAAERLQEAASALELFATAVETGRLAPAISQPYGRQVERAMIAYANAVPNAPSLIEHAIAAELARAQGV